MNKTAMIIKTTCFLGLLVVAASCGSLAYHRGAKLIERGHYDEAIPNLEAAGRANPHNIKYKTTLVRAKLSASMKHVNAAKMYLARKEFQQAADELEKALKLDPGNQHARDTLNNVLAAAAEAEKAKRSNNVTLEQLKKKAEADTGVPKLDPDSNIPIVLKFKNTRLKTILDAISKASGINFMYDDKASMEKKLSVDFAKVKLEQVLNYLMMQSKCFYKVLDPYTIMVIPDNKRKRMEYEDQVIRTFYLSNADVKDVFQLVRSILQIRKMAMNQKLNSITIQDTPAKVAIAQKIIENNDKSKGEVVVDVELLEVNSNLTRDLGIDLSNKSFTIGPRHNLSADGSGLAPGSPVPLTDLGKTISHGLMVAPVPNLLVNMLLSDSDSQVLAKPQLRVMEGEKAMVHIGDRIPIPTSQQYLGSVGTNTNYTPMTSYTYQDIGVKIEVTPRVHHNQEVTLKLKTEVSSVTGYVKAANSLTGDQPIIGTREANTVIRLKDGETSLLAGLIRKEDKTALSGLPGLSEVPILRRLFSDTKDEKSSTDVVMLVTPHIVRMPNITEENLEPLYVGTKDNPRLAGPESSPFARMRKEAAQQSQAEAPHARAEKSEAPEKTDSTKAPDDKETPPESQNPDKIDTQPSGRLLMSPTSIDVAPGAPIVLNLVLVGAKAARGMSARVTFPGDLVKFQACDEGAFFKLGGGTTTFSGSPAAPGTVLINVTKNGDAAALGSGLVARIRFTAQAEGSGRITVSSADLLGFSGLSATLPSVFANVRIVKKKTPEPQNPNPAIPMAKGR